jgi:transketolase|tara:strand:- start:3767 stop:4606 length:840 start_codon:yes stop_codon:yes gene_type:complete
MEENKQIKQLDEINKFSLNIRRNILDMALSAGSSSAHLGGALSIADIVSVLFSFKMKLNKSDSLDPDRDRFILSKGHACLAYYAALSEMGYILKEELNTFEKNNSNLLGHPVINKKLGIEFSNGSLGMGLSLGIGVALSALKKKKSFKVFVVVGDGECNEGSMWEAAMAAPNFKLNNLHVIIDRNNFQQTGSNKEIMDLGNLKNKWETFGWDAVELNGNNHKELLNYFSQSDKINKPKAIIANTIKGKGFSFFENDNNWHHAVLTKSLYDQAINELQKK